MTVQDYFLKLLQWFDNHNYFDLNKDIPDLFPDDPDCEELLNKIIKDKSGFFVRTGDKLYLKDQWMNLEFNLKIKGATAAGIAFILNNILHNGKSSVSPLSIGEEHINQLIGILTLQRETVEKSFSA